MPVPIGERGGRRVDRAVVVLADPARSDLVDGWVDKFAEDHLTVLTVDGASDLDNLLARLVRLPAQDAIVVVLGDEAVASLAGNHGRPLRPPGSAPASRGRIRGGSDGVRSRCGTEARAGQPKDLPLQQGARVSDDLVLITKRGRHALAAREEQVGDVLAAREPELGVSILEVRPAGRLELEVEDVVVRAQPCGPGPRASTIRR